MADGCTTGAHVVDTLRLLLGGEMETVRSEVGSSGRPNDPCLDGLMRCARWPGVRILIESHPESAFQLFEGEVRLKEGSIRFCSFGEEIYVDEVRTNQADERELRSSRRLDPVPSPSAMQTLYYFAFRHLCHGERELMACTGFEQARQTMTAILDFSEKRAE